jgi:hypothetical protein
VPRCGFSRCGWVEKGWICKDIVREVTGQISDKIDVNFVGVDRVRTKVRIRVKKGVALIVNSQDAHRTEPGRFELSK